MPKMQTCITCTALSMVTAELRYECITRSDRQMPVQRNFQQIHRRSFHVSRHDAGRRRAALSKLFFEKCNAALEGKKDFNNDHREEFTDLFQSIPGVQECDEENAETWMACNAKDCGFQMLNDDEILPSVQKVSNPVDDETDDDEDNNNAHFSRSTGLIKSIKLEGQKTVTANWYTPVFQKFSKKLMLED
ncbi:uncharacterized protein TNCV_1741381 [Trichonephila clavipes]|uniref:Uncharacterized protein n=1 Tax=Trichonephila clavipes TaxID=2585209 RepID=A0A8X6UY74_TRICX|nr:uncharacterized protein TNCV_1741381 [Trichonephila clavipes]